MKVKGIIVVLCILLLVGISGYSLYAFFAAQNTESPRGTFVNAQQVDGDEDYEEYDDLFKGTETGRFI